jgi:hypothetical protein
MRRHRDKVCPVCQTAFVAFGKQIFCSRRCSKRHWWRTNRGLGAPRAVRAEQLALGIGEDTAVT